MLSLDSIAPRLDSPLLPDLTGPTEGSPFQPMDKILSQQGIPTRPATPSPPNTNQHTGLRVLVVDDNQIALAVTRRMLQRQFSHLVADGGAVYARSGAEALERAQKEAFDVIMLDMHMPAPHGPGGLDCARAIRAGLPGPAGRANSRAHLVAVTTESGPEHRQLYRPVLDGLIPKPVRLEHMGRYLASVREEAEWALPLAPRLTTDEELIPLPPTPTDDRVFFDVLDDTSHFPAQLHQQTMHCLASLPSRSLPPTPRGATALERLTIASADEGMLRAAASPVPSLVDDAGDAGELSDE